MEGVDYLAEERCKAEFDADAMKIVWPGSKHDFKIFNSSARLIASDPLFKNTLRKAAHASKWINELRLTEEEAEMFMPAIKGQGTEEQQAKWLSLAYKVQIIRCYTKTKFGHVEMSKVLKQLPQLNPKVTMSTHAVFYTRLIIDRKEYVVNGFIVQMRSLDDHSLLPGITVGDIGMRFGNGDLKLYGQWVTREGKYLQSDVPRQLLYGYYSNMYSAMRRQFGSQKGGPKTQMIDYKTQQSRLFPLWLLLMLFNLLVNV
uniref:Uncharacterized protein n=1 Tax=Kalanchoe fedtschenkoi TaxID=63787 RepID=A0A7N0VMD5_KALFE